MPTFEVIVGNIGIVHTSIYEDVAIKSFHYYVYQSTHGEGRAKGEAVVLMKDGEIIAEHAGIVDGGEN